MVVSEGGQGLSSCVPGPSTSEEEEEEEEAASELMLLGTLLAYWSSFATLCEGEDYHSSLLIQCACTVYWGEGETQLSVQM